MRSGHNSNDNSNRMKTESITNTFNSSTQICNLWQKVQYGVVRAWAFLFHVLIDYVEILVSLIKRHFFKPHPIPAILTATYTHTHTHMQTNKNILYVYCAVSWILVCPFSHCTHLWLWMCGKMCRCCCCLSAELNRMCDCARGREMWQSVYSISYL